MKSSNSDTILQLGNTPLIKAANIGKKLNLNSIYLKLEQSNPTGTHKDRAAAKIVEKAKALGYKGVTIGTCGNFGVSVSYYCHLYGLKSELFIPGSYAIPRLNEMKNNNANIEFVKGTYEDAVSVSAQYAKDHRFFDANPHGVGAKIAIDGYKNIAYEIVKELGTIPMIVWIPVGNGTLLTGVHLGLLEKKVKYSIGAVSSLRNNEITESYIHGHRVGLKGRDLKETAINEPLLNWLPTQLNESLQALKDTNGYAYGATDIELVSAKKMIESNEKIVTTPSSAAGLVGLIKFKNKFSESTTNVIILTS